MPHVGRARRIGQEIQRILPEVIRLELKDPGVTGLITITAVDVAHDLKHAKVLVTRLGDDAALPETLAALNRATSFLRRSLAARMRMRTVPALTFVFDSSVERGVRLTKLIEEAVGGDSARAADDGQPTD